MRILLTVLFLHALLSVTSRSNQLRYLGIFEVVSVAIFTAEYGARFYAVGADARYTGLKRLAWMLTFYALIDIASIVPFYVNVAVTGSLTSSSTFVRCFRLLRLLKVRVCFVFCVFVFCSRLVHFTDFFDLTFCELVGVLIFVSFCFSLYRRPSTSTSSRRLTRRCATTPACSASPRPLPWSSGSCLPP